VTGDDAVVEPYRRENMAIAYMNRLKQSKTDVTGLIEDDKTPVKTKA
jgi:hypothetical protein